jgi:hypothetical protein
VSKEKRDQFKVKMKSQKIHRSVLSHHLEVKKEERKESLSKEKRDQFKVKMKSRKIHRSVLSHHLEVKKDGGEKRERLKKRSVQGEDEITENSSLSAVTSSRS